MGIEPILYNNVTRVTKHTRYCLKKNPFFIQHSDAPHRKDTKKEYQSKIQFTFSAVIKSILQHARDRKFDMLLIAASDPIIPPLWQNIASSDFNWIK